jgi:hypothetical protein
LVKAGYTKDGVFVDTSASIHSKLMGDPRRVLKVTGRHILLETRNVSGGVSHLAYGKAAHWSFDGDIVTYDAGHSYLQYKVESVP